MIETFLLFATALSPNFSLAHPGRGEFEADIFAVNAEKNTDQTLALLTAEEEADLESTVAKVKIGDDDEMTVTMLRDAEGSPRVAYLYRLDLAETERRWVCRVRFSFGGGQGMARSTRWCLSFIGGDEYRRTLRIPAN